MQSAVHAVLLVSWLKVLEKSSQGELSNIVCRYVILEYLDML